MEPWMKQLEDRISARVNGHELVHYKTVILPRIVADFYKQLSAAGVNIPVNEEYCMEDGSMVIVLKGIKDNAGKCRIVSVDIK